MFNVFIHIINFRLLLRKSKKAKRVIVIGYVWLVMRSVILSFTLPLFKLNNVTIQKNHAIVENKYGTFTIHLGSGVIHKQGGTMINVLPVHSSHRGKIFLPFVDDDPKTAEIITKVLTFAEDNKLKDPTILEQIR